MGADCDRAHTTVLLRGCPASRARPSTAGQGDGALVGERVERSVCLSITSGDVAANFLQKNSRKLPRGFSVLHRMDGILKVSLWELVRPLLSPDVVIQLRVTARCWNIGETYGPFGAFFLRDMVTLRKRTCSETECVTRQRTDGALIGHV